MRCFIRSLVIWLASFSSFSPATAGSMDLMIVCQDQMDIENFARWVQTNNNEFIRLQVSIREGCRWAVEDLGQYPYRTLSVSDQYEIRLYFLPTLEKGIARLKRNQNKDKREDMNV